MNASDFRLVEPSAILQGTLSVPGDKSISHRAAMLSAVATGRSKISGFLMSEDCLNTLKSVEKLGAVVESGEALFITGTGGSFVAPDEVIDLGNSGTGMRLLSGMLAGCDFVSELTGDDSLLTRPMKRIEDPLLMFGAQVELKGQNGCAPVRIKGGKLKAIDYSLPVASAQVKSCVLLSGLFADGRTTVTEPVETRDHTEKMLDAMGADIQVDGLNVSIEGPGSLSALNMIIPGDFSSAAFWIVAAACSSGSQVVINDVGLNPRRTALLDVLGRMGADVKIENRSIKVDGWQEESGSITANGRRLTGTTIAGDEIPNLIDELPIIAVAGALADGETVIKDAQELRVKESDRIATVVEGLRVMGVDVEERADGMIIHGCDAVKGGGEVLTKGDHRIAMAFSVLSLFADKPTKISGVKNVDTSYPRFFEDMEALRA